MLKHLYARIVLFLIRPALELRHEQQRFDSAAFGAEAERIVGIELPNRSVISVVAGGVDASGSVLPQSSSGR